MIRERSGKDFDNTLGPSLVSIALLVALIFNFVLKWREVEAGANSGGAVGVQSMPYMGREWMKKKFLWEGDLIYEMAIGRSRA